MSRSAVQSDGCSEFRALALNRRDVLQAGVLGTVGLGLADLLRLQTTAAGRVRKSPVRSVIVLQKYGAPSHVDLWDMKPAAPIEVRGEFQPINSKWAFITPFLR